MTKKDTRHPSLERLLVYARKKGVESYTDLARAMDAEVNAISNWSRRGVSKQGALKAEQLFGCTASWVLDGGTAQVGSYTPSPWALEIAWELDQFQDRATRNRLIFKIGQVIIEARGEELRSGTPIHTPAPVGTLAKQSDEPHQ